MNKRCDSSNISELSDINLIENRREQFGNFEVFDSNALNAKRSISCHSQNNQDPSSQYLIAVHSDTSSPQIVKSGNSEFVDSDVYLAVTYEKML